MKIIIVGHGGHSKVIRDIVLTSSEHQILGFLDDKYDDLTINANKIMGPISSIKKIVEYNNKIKFVIGIGENKIRKKIYEKLNLSNESFVTLVHKSAVISPNAKIGKGTVIMPNTVVNADTYIGNHSIINTGSIIEHDNNIGDFVHISPSTVLTGNVRIEDGVLVGAGTTIIPSIQIGKWSIIGAGATVTKNILANCTAVGVPAKVIKRINDKEKVGV